MKVTPQEETAPSSAATSRRANLDAEALDVTVPQNQERVVPGNAAPAPRHETPLARSVRLELERVLIEKSV